MAKPWPSVVVPSHNDDRWLGGAVQSLVDRNDAGVEVIVIDASTTDASLRIVGGFSAQLDTRAQRRPDSDRQGCAFRTGARSATHPPIFPIFKNRRAHLSALENDAPGTADQATLRSDM
jgi:glycosyltransferase involved in cell wall biosynthesis